MIRRYKEVLINVERAKSAEDAPLLYDKLSKLAEVSGKQVQDVMIELIELALMSLEAIGEKAAEEESVVKLPTDAEVARATATRARQPIVIAGR